MIVEKKIGFIFIEGFADWEFGILSASAVEWFSARAISITPDGKPVKSMSGFRLTPERSAAPDRNADLDAVVVVGSDNWAAPRRCRRHLRRHAGPCSGRPLRGCLAHQQRP
jgi:putative intracellular protease/amidase